MLNQHQTIKDNIAKYNKANPLAEFLIPLIGEKKRVSILDVGSGPYSIIGDYQYDVEVEIIHIDNQDFTEFYEKYNFKPISNIWNINMEQLHGVFPDNEFDIVCCINALDHTNDAQKAVEEMIRVCKPEGWVYIDCHLDQADTGHKHKWNAKADGLFMSDKSTFNLKDYGFKIQFIDNGGESRYNRIIATLQKGEGDI